jgi:hypothetical protein
VRSVLIDEKILDLAKDACPLGLQIPLIAQHLAILENGG